MDNEKKNISNANFQPNSSFETISEERSLAEYASDQIIYSGIFVDPGEIYDAFPPQLSHKIRDPHITTAYRPDAKGVHLDDLGSSASIQIIGYGNNGQNEGLLVKIAAESPIIQKTIDERVAPDEAGELKPVLSHITLSIADGAEAVNTKYLDFKPLETPINLSGKYALFCKDGTLISNKDTLKEMKESGFTVEQESDPDRL